MATRSAVRNLRKMTCESCGRVVCERFMRKSDSSGGIWFLPKKYCSVECQANGRRKTRTARAPQNCLTCGKLLEGREFIRKDGTRHSWYVPKNYCSRKCAGIAAGEIGRQLQIEAARGWYLDKHGYVIRSSPRGGYQQPEHRYVMEQALGRKLKKHETVHHKNGVRTDNRLENLELWSSRHGRGQRVGEQDIWSGMIPSWVLEDHSPY